jgi:hypothetical protein
VDQVKKANKWTCKMCGEKQSLKKVKKNIFISSLRFVKRNWIFQVFFNGSSKDCREHVQQANARAFSMKDISFDNLQNISKPTKPQTEITSTSGSKKFDEFFEDDESFEGLSYDQSQIINSKETEQTSQTKTWGKSTSSWKSQKYNTKSNSNFQSKKYDGFKKSNGGNELQKNCYKKPSENTKPYSKTNYSSSSYPGGPGINYSLPLVDFHKKDGFKIPPLTKKETPEKPKNCKIPEEFFVPPPVPTAKTGSFQFKVGSSQRFQESVENQKEELSQFNSQSIPEFDDDFDQDFDENEFRTLELSQL